MTPNQDTATAVSLNQRIEDFLLEKGAIKVGFATTETLEGGPPSVDLTYKLPGARSAISFAVPLQRDPIRLFLSKEDREPHEADNAKTMMYMKSLSWELAEMIKKEGHMAKGTTSHLKYRTELPDWQKKQIPDISHRYIAVRSGVGSFGWSGNVGIKGYGAAVMLGTCITTAELEPTSPIPENESFCDKCKLCVSACAYEMFERDNTQSVTIGGETFSFAKRIDFMRCGVSCGGASGLAKSGKWSSWSPGRFEVPFDQEGMEKACAKAMAAQRERPTIPGGVQIIRLHNNPDAEVVKAHLTCGNCQLICWGNKDDTAKNIRLLHTSGCVVQDPDGTLRAVPPEEAERIVEQMDPERRALYAD